MQIKTSRFGELDIDPEQAIRFQRGLIGFNEDREFVVVPQGKSGLLAWLQSTETPELAFPVVSAHAFADYPDVPLEPALDNAGLEGVEDIALMVVLSAPQDRPATVNLLAPLVVDAATRRGAQLILENSRYTAREIFAFGEVELARQPTQSNDGESQPGDPSAEVPESPQPASPETVEPATGAKESA